MKTTLISLVDLITPSAISSFRKWGTTKLGLTGIFLTAMLAACGGGAGGGAPADMGITASEYRTEFNKQAADFPQFELSMSSMTVGLESGDRIATATISPNDVDVKGTLASSSNKLTKLEIYVTESIAELFDESVTSKTSTLIASGIISSYVLDSNLSYNDASEIATEMLQDLMEALLSDPSPSSASATKTKNHRRYRISYEKSTDGLYVTLKYEVTPN